MITLKFDGKIVEVKKNDAGLYCLNDIFKASGSSMVKSPSQWNRYIKSDGGVNYAKKHSLASNNVNTPKKHNSESSVVSGTKKHSFTVISGKGRQGTYADEQAVYEYASWISPEFKKAVYECFTLAANGDGQGAVDAAVSVAVPKALLDNIDHYTDMVQAAIGAWDTKQGGKYGKNAYNIIWRHIINKVCTGTCTSELKLSFDVKSVKDYLLKTKNVKGLGAYLATVQMVLPMLELGLPYDTIKYMFFRDDLVESKKVA